MITETFLPQETKRVLEESLDRSSLSIVATITTRCHITAAPGIYSGSSGPIWVGDGERYLDVQGRMVIGFTLRMNGVVQESYDDVAAPANWILT